MAWLILFGHSRVEAKSEGRRLETVSDKGLQGGREA